MPSFDVVSTVNWSEIQNAIQHTLKEITQRFDFKGVKTTIDSDEKKSEIVLWTSEQSKLDALKDIFEQKLIKRGLSLLSFEAQKLEEAHGQSGRQMLKVHAGISKEKGKEIIALIKTTKMKVQAQIQDEQVRVSAKSKDDLQEVIHFLKTQQEKVKLPLLFENFRS